MDILNRSGEFIMRIEQNRFYISLYVLENQFVEVYFNKENSKIEEIGILDARDENLNLYADEIKFTDLF